MRVMIIDDSKTMRTILKSVLLSAGATATEEAGDGKEALAKVGAFAPDLILCDWNMPVMDGITFVREYRATVKKVPIIMVTTEAEKSRVIEAIKAGVNNYAIKPFTPESLKKVIQITLDKAKAAA